MANGTVTRVYSNFRGIDARGEDVNLMRSPDCLNVWKDYRKGSAIRTRPGWELICPLEGKIHGIYFYKEEVLVHAGGAIYKVVNGVGSVLCNVHDGMSNGFVYTDEKKGLIFYFLDGQRYICYDGENVQEVEGYVPTTTIGRSPAGSGTVNEDVNMLTGRRKNTFLADNASAVYVLDTKELDDTFKPLVTVNDVPWDNFTVDYAAGKITFNGQVPMKEGTDGQDNVVIEFQKTIPGYRESILGCKLLQLFDNRVFVSGNDQYPNVVWHCSLHDPSYFSDKDYYQEGLDAAKVKGLVAGNNALWVFREPSQANTTVFYHTPSMDAEYGKIYPSAHSSVTTGCVGKAINFNDDIIFFSERGMEGISGNITTEQVVAHRSSLVDPLLLSQEEYPEMLLEEWEGYLLVFVGKKVFLADSRTAFSYENHMEYEWFVWDLPCAVTCTCVQDGILYLGTDGEGVFTLTVENASVESYWVTPKDKFKYPNLQKTTNKRGCVAEATGDISVYAKEEDTEFELIGTHKDVKDYFVSRIKRKKFKDLQLKFHSDTHFSLESVSLEVFVGAYIKR